MKYRGEFEVRQCGMDEKWKILRAYDLRDN